MPRRKRVVGVRQKLRGDMTRFGELAAERVRAMAPLPGSVSKGRAGRNGSKKFASNKRLADVWAELDVDEETRW